MKTFAEKSKDSEATFDKSGKRQCSKNSEAVWSSVSVPISNFQIQRKAECACGGDCATCQSKNTNLAISKPNDAAEIEADHIANLVMRSSANRKYEPLSKNITPIVQTKGESKTSEINSELSRKIISSKGGGGNLDGNTQSFMQSRFGADFSRVKIHTDGEAAQMSRELNAKAFTIGNDIYFNEGQYQPNSESGRHLLAHELTHTQQQVNGNLIHRADLSSPRMAGNTLFEAVLDNTQVLELGDTGPEVRRLQQMLIDLGIPFPVSGANGTFNAETQTAVQEFQRRNPPLVIDGRVGLRTIAALDAAFPAVTLPVNRTAPWTMTCVLRILCPWNRHLVENVLPTFNIITFDSRTFPTETWDGSTWVSGTFNSGGFRGGRNMGFLNSTTCEQMAFTIYHEGWHGQQPSGLTGVVDTERDAYINAEQWSIDMGIPGQGTFTNRATGAAESFRQTVGGERVVNEPAAETFVRQRYGGVSSIPGERILGRVGATDVRVRRPNGTEYTRPAAAGESVRGTVSMPGRRPIAPASWVCP